ncbi:hypothetical protein ScPMuIL_013539 [Solemya velum]
MSAKAESVSSALEKRRENGMYNAEYMDVSIPLNEPPTMSQHSGCQRQSPRLRRIDTGSRANSYERNILKLTTSLTSDTLVKVSVRSWKQHKKHLTVP